MSSPLLALQQSASNDTATTAAANGTAEANGNGAVAEHADANGVEGDEKSNGDHGEGENGEASAQAQSKEGAAEQPGEQKTTLKALILSKDVGALIGKGVGCCVLETAADRNRFPCGKLLRLDRT